MSGKLTELAVTQRAMQELAHWHENQRDTIPWSLDGATAQKHNKAASDCYSAAIALGEYMAAITEQSKHA